MAEESRRPSRVESAYYAHMGFDPAHQREVLGFYVPMFAEPVLAEPPGGSAQGASGGGRGPVLELGCGRGEFLGLLREAGVEACGVDVDPGMVELARAQGLDVVEDDALALLHADPAPGPYQGVFCAHFLEHLTPEQVVDLLAGVRRVLAPGGRFVAVTPNPACYAVLSHDFWRDPTHVRFYDVPLVEFFCRQAGFEVESTGTNPANHPGPPPEFLVPEPVVHPGLADLIQSAMSKLAPPSGEEVEPDLSWAYELAHAVSVLSGRLQETAEALRELRGAHDSLVRGLYQANETFVVARG